MCTSSLVPVSVSRLPNGELESVRIIGVEELGVLCSMVVIHLDSLTHDSFQRGECSRQLGGGGKYASITV